MRLLLVEDDLLIQALLTHSLTKAGYHVPLAAHAKTAERLATEDRHDVFLVDQGFPA